MNPYVAISPCRNEAKHVRHTLESVISQTLPPALWVIVDDGSTDGTGDILKEYEERCDFIRVLRRHDRGRRSVGPGVVDAFYTGYGAVDATRFPYLCKLDMDLDLPKTYFEILVRRMERNPRIGTCSGKPYYPDARSQQLVSEHCGDEMSVGMTKFYRTACFQEIGGFVRHVMWDGIDCHRCRMRGWIACSWDDPELRFVHLRPMGSSDRNWIRGRMRHGMGQYFMGTGLPYMTASALYRMSHPPFVIGALAMWWGYVSSALTRKQRYEDQAFRRFLRQYQRACLLYGKKRATRRLNEKQGPHWRRRTANATTATPPHSRSDAAHV